MAGAGISHIWNAYFRYGNLSVYLHRCIHCFYIGFTSFLRSVILLGTAIDLKRHKYKNWKKKNHIGSLAGVIFSIILLAEPLSFKDTSRPVLTGDIYKQESLWDF